MIRIVLLWSALLLGGCKLVSDSDATVTPALSTPDSLTLLSQQALPLFEDPAHKFSVYFPMPPQRSTYENQLDIGTLAMTQWVAHDAAGQYYVLSYADYPEAVLRLGSEEQLLRGVEEHLLSALQAKVTQRQPLLLQNKYKGVAFYAQAQRRHWHLYYQVYLVEDRLYQLGLHSAIGPIGVQDSVDFFGSFGIVQ